MLHPVVRQYVSKLIEEQGSMMVRGWEKQSKGMREQRERGRS